MQPDFSHLYRAIGVRPECSLDVFRQAFRRHVASRHPDRGDDAAAPGEGVLPLSEVNALYEMAMQFHRRHGRLPGAAPAAGAGEAVDASEAAGTRLIGTGAPAGATTPAPRPSPRSLREVPPDPPPSGTGRWIPWLVVAALLVVAIGYWQAPSHAPRAPAAAAGRHADASADALPAQLALGMRADTVRAIQGEPLRMRDGEWDYGPSWLRFERGRLVDWYSSPLNRLKTATSSPQPLSIEAPDATPAQ